jgi:hypothetical protein
VRRKAAVHRASGVEVEELDAAALRDAEPSLREGLAGALRVPATACCIRPTPRAGFSERAVRRGASVRAGQAVSAVGARSVADRRGPARRGRGRQRGGRRAPALTPGLPIAPRKGPPRDHGPLSRLRAAPARGARLPEERARPRVESVAFNLQPRRTGQMLLGSSREFVGFDAAINRPLRAR